MNKRDRLTQMLDEQEASTAARLKSVPLTVIAPRPAHPDDGRTSERASGREYMLVNNIVPDPSQPRKAENIDQEEIRRLGASLREGQLQPLIVEWDAEVGNWKIVDGERRWMGAKAAGIERLWCMFSQKKMSAGERLTMQMKANLLRTDLKDIERAQGFQRLMELNDWTQQQVAEEMHLERSTVTKALQLLALPPAIQEHVKAGTIAPSVGIELGKIEDAGEQAEVAQKILDQGLSRTEAIAEVKAKAPRGRAGKAPQMATFKATNGCKVTVERRRPPSDEEIDDALQEMLAARQQKQRAA